MSERPPEWFAKPRDGIVAYLSANGGEVGDVFVQQDSYTLYARFSLGERHHLIGVTNEAGRDLDHWAEAEIDGFLNSYRVVPGVNDLNSDEFLLVRTSPGVPSPGSTYLDRGIVVSVAKKVDFGIS